MMTVNPNTKIASLIRRPGIQSTFDPPWDHTLISVAGQEFLNQ